MPSLAAVLPCAHTRPTSWLSTVSYVVILWLVGIKNEVNIPQLMENLFWLETVEIHCKFRRRSSGPEAKIPNPLTGCWDKGGKPQT